MVTRFMHLHWFPKGAESGMRLQQCGGPDLLCQPKRDCNLAAGRAVRVVMFVHAQLAT